MAAASVGRLPSPMESVTGKPSGFFVLDKPEGLSSARALNAVKRRVPRGTKVGHAGTLDPFATGVLVVLVGRATKQCESVMGLAKGYETTLCLGATTPSLDPETPTIPSSAARPPSREAVERVLGQFEGEIDQLPPSLSAVKVGGKRAYDLARRGQAVELQPRRVRLHELRLIAYEWPDVRLALTCGRGFYVRSLARDIGQALGIGGYLTRLRRTFVGPFTLERAATPEQDPLPLLPVAFLGGPRAPGAASGAGGAAGGGDGEVGRPARRL